jgi:hypothetical protein
VLILKGVKVICFDTLLQVLILNSLAQHDSSNEQEGKSQGNRAGEVDRNLPRWKQKRRQKVCRASNTVSYKPNCTRNDSQRQGKLRQMSNLFRNGPFSYLN